MSSPHGWKPVESPKALRHRKSGTFPAYLDDDSIQHERVPLVPFDLLVYRTIRARRNQPCTGLRPGYPQRQEELSGACHVRRFPKVAAVFLALILYQAKFLVVLDASSQADMNAFAKSIGIKSFVISEQDNLSRFSFMARTVKIAHLIDFWLCILFSELSSLPHCEMNLGASLLSRYSSICL